MSKLVIQGHSTQGNEVIARLEMLRGINTFNLNGTETNCYYYIDDINNKIYHCLDIDPQSYIVYTLEEFEEKFPHKVGDRVSSKYLKNYKIEKMEWEDTNNRVIYKLQGMGWYSADELQPYKEETIEITEEFYNKHCINCGSQRCTHNGEWLEGCEHYKEEIMKQIKIDMPKGYEFFGIDDDNKIVLAKEQSQYPKTYEECYKVLNTYCTMPSRPGYKEELIAKFQELLICRDAYWKIAGDWKPNWKDFSTQKYSISVDKDDIILSQRVTGSRIFVFPTEEMRDAFYENFKDLIERCKELL